MKARIQLSDPDAVGRYPGNRYQYAGLGVASEIALPEWRTFEDPLTTTEPDVVIELEEISGFDPATEENARVVTPDYYRYVVPGVGAFCVRDGLRITVALLRGVEPRRARPWLIGSTWAALCYQRGMYLIHASAVMVGKGAVLFCARAGGGKSTMAAQLNIRGHALVSDDLCHLDFPSGRAPLIFRSAPRIKLWSDALRQIGWNSEELEPDHSRAGKFHAVRTDNNLAQSAPVRAIYLLDWGDFGIRRLSGLIALRQFLHAATYRPKMMELTQQLARHTERSLALLQCVPVWELRRPRDLASLGHTTDLLTEHWLSYD